MCEDLSLLSHSTMIHAYNMAIYASIMLNVAPALPFFLLAKKTNYTAATTTFDDDDES